MMKMNLLQGSLLVAAVNMLGAMPSMAAFVIADFVGDPNAEVNEWVDFSTSPADTPEGWAHQPDSLIEWYNPGAPTVQQAGAPTILVTTSDASSFYTSSGNIYSFSGTKSYLLDDSPGLVGDSSGLVVRRVFFQISSFGNEMDYASMRLNHDAGGGSVSIAADLMEEIDRVTIPGDFGGEQVTYRWGWDISPDDEITNYTLTWSDAGTSVSFMSARLETLGVEAIPEPSVAVLIAMVSVALISRRRR